MATKNFNVKNGLTAGNITLDASTNTTTTSNLVATGNVLFTGPNVSLGSVSNLKITGGTNGYFLQTDGSGVLTWAAVTAGTANSITNGNSNVSIPAANGNVLISVAGNANIVTVTGTGVNVAGTLNATGNANVGNLGTSGLITATGNITTAGRLISTIADGNAPLVVTSTTRVANLNVAYANVADFINVTTQSSGNAYLLLSNALSGNIAETANANFVVNTSNGALYATKFIGDGSGLSNITVSSISNGTSNVSIPAANGNVLIGVAGNANIVTVTGTGANISGYANITGSAVVGNGFTMTTGNANFDSATLFVDGTNNRVGVGITNPAYKLDVSGEARVAGTLHFLSTLRNYSSDMILNQAIDANMLFYTNAAEKMRINNVGNVGIGTNNPLYKLEVNGSFAATTKSFVIDHPTKPDMKLRYGSLEGPENGVYVRGRNKGDTIQLPDYWTGLVDEFSITVNLTPIGSHQKLYVKSIENNTVIVGGGFFDEMEYFYTVFAERKDVDKLVVEI